MFMLNKLFESESESIYLKRIVLLCTVVQCGLILQNLP